MNHKRINSVLNQECNARSEKRLFEIYNDKFIKIAVKNLLTDHHYHINLSLIGPWPAQHRSIAWEWLAAVIYFAIATAAYTAYLFTYPESAKLERLLPFIVVFLLLTLGSLLMFFYKSPNVMEFHSRYGNCVLIRLLNNRPNKKEFKDFVEEIKLRSLSASQSLKIEKSKMLGIELEELRRLHDEGIIPGHAYEAAKDRIMKMHL